VRCIEDAIWYGIDNAASESDRPNVVAPMTFRCAGPWALASYVGTSGDDITTLLHWNGSKLLGAWEAAPDACANAEVPASLRHDVCESG
jgi:hypothetical protein